MASDSSTQRQQEKLQFVILDPVCTIPKASKKNIRSHVARFAHQKIRRDRELEFQQVDHGGNKVVSRVTSYRGYTTTSDAVSAYNPINALSGGIDPSFSGATRLSHFEQRLLHHFINFVVPDSAAYYPRSKSEPDYRESMIEHWMPFAMTQPAVMDGLFAAACRSLALQYQTDFYLQASFAYNEKCIQSVRAAVSNDRNVMAGDSTIAQILMLASSEFLTGNVAGTCWHINAVAELVKSKGGLQNLGLGGFLRQLVLWHDRTSASYTGALPNFVHTAESHINRSFDHSLPRFKDPGILSQLSVDMVDILNDISVFTGYINSLSLPWNESEHSSLALSTHELEVQLIVLGSNYQKQSSCRYQSEIEECLFFAVRVFVNLMPHEFSFPPRGCKILATKMKSTLSKIMLVPWHDWSGTLLWIAFMGTVVTRAGETKEQDLSSFFELLRKQSALPSQPETVEYDLNFWILKLVEISISLGTISEEGVKFHLRRFLWMDSLCEPYFRDIWDRFEAMLAALEGSHQALEG